jgi:hypothetical protein
MFDDVLNEVEAKAAPVSAEDKLIVTDLAKKERWKAKRVGKITASTLPDLMKGGKGVPWGETSKKVLYPIKYERRTGLTREHNDNIYQFKFGHENEPRAIAWLKRNGYPDIKCSDDFEDIIFNQPFEGFGDSPDFTGDKIVGEIKCHLDQGKIEKYRDELTVIHDKHENYYQFIGHFIGDPEAEACLFVSYDAYADDAHVVKMYRKDHLVNIDKVIARIKDANKVLDAAIAGETTIGEINEYLKS